MNVQKSNRLIQQKSPYLLQHAYNPVEWYPWGPEAFAASARDNKPIFLSIGYSTCHWCHVMEHESFEDEETAQLLNEYFVPVKVDREERPDIDSIYMSFVTATTGSGGWPLSIFLTPQKKPFYGGTYFPPEARYGSPGFKDLLLSVHNNWTKQESQVRESAETIVKALAQKIKTKTATAQIFTPEVLTKAFDQLASNFDANHGGFGHAPKFPMGHTLSFLLRYWKNNHEPEALDIVEKTLSAMASGGINDQLGGGFHRYSTDAHWQVPHFEKMLYDQALLAKIYLEAFAATGKKVYADTARQTFDYVLRDMQDKQGGFYSAQDADSLEPGGHSAAEKKEGAFYLWTQAELKNLLSDDEFSVVNFYYATAKTGNAEVDPHGEFVGKNILHGKHSLEETAAFTKTSLAEMVGILQRAKEKLLKERGQRPRPHLDDKVLTDWNGLMISALALAGNILQEKRYLMAAETAARFILEKVRRNDGRLLHRYRDGEAGILAGLEDYAFLVSGLLDLYENSFDPRYFKEAVRLNKEMVDLFWDEQNSGFFLTPADGEELIYRPKDVYDGAVPSGNSQAAHNLLRLYHFTFDEKDLKKSEAVFKVFHDEVSHYPGGYTQMMMALQFYFGPVKEIVLSGDITMGKGRELLDVILSSWMAQKILIVKTPHNGAEVETLMPLTQGQSGDQGVVYFCENRVCRPPITDPATLKKVLEENNPVL